ncbi:MAG: UPF0149 family protein [Kangiellaceae bacterium]|nr:UPF0149 family protein [Kangiellaceae bacterium]MCW8999117.1 UPF0149 family protein [Kangiellaceae bacterium]MCW9017387.1 UPF0149 family protein [Kangiellaceae bacterium]
MSSKSYGVFELDKYLKLFEDETMSSQAFPPYFILGQITAVASGPELILMREWMAILSQTESDIEFENQQQAESFIELIQDWWNYCVEQFDKDKALDLIVSFKFTKETGVSEAARDFIQGYLTGYDWLKEDWDYYIDEESEESSVIGMATLLALQISVWPETLEVADNVPDLVSGSEDTPEELMILLATLISGVGNIGLVISRQETQLPPVETIADLDKEIGRDDPCPCGSGKKFRKCCLH